MTSSVVTPLKTASPRLGADLFDIHASFANLYAASLRPDFKGVGILRKTYTVETLDHDIRTQGGGYLADDTFDRIRVIQYDPAKTHSIAESLAAHPLHTDASFAETPLERFILHFKVVDPGMGGVSTFFPTSWILEAIPDAYRRALETAIVGYARTGDSGLTKCYRGQMLTWRGDGTYVFRWRYDEIVRPQVVDARGTLIEEAIGWIKTFIDRTPPILYHAGRDDTFLIDNCMMLHGRTPLTAGSPRVAFRAWIA